MSRKIRIYEDWLEGFEYKGIWWLPEKEDAQFTGTLQYIPSKSAILELMDYPTDISSILKTEIQEGGESAIIDVTFKSISRPQIILGRSSDGKEITLYDIYNIEPTISSSRILITKLYIRTVFVDAHFKKVEEIKFNSISVCFTHLDDWVNISVFEFPKRTNGEIVHKYKILNDIVAKVNEELKICIEFHVKEFMEFMKEVYLRQQVSIRIEPIMEKQFDYYRNIIEDVERFLSFGISIPVYHIAVYGQTEAAKMVIRDKDHKEDKIIYHNVMIFDSFWRISNDIKRFWGNDMLFSYYDISQQFESILQKWFALTEVLEPIYDIYFGLLYTPMMHVEGRLLFLTQAIEAYHRRKRNNLELPEEEHQKMLIDILNCIPGQYKKWTEEQLKYSNERSFRSRLKELIDNFPEALGGTDIDYFVHKIVITRNYLTHYDEKLKEESAKGEELFNLTLKIKALVEACLLMELGFNLDIIKNLISKRKKNYKLIVQ